MEKIFKGNDGKIYTTEKECIAADEAWEKAHEAEIKAKKAKTEDLAKIQSAANRYLAKVTENKKLKEKLAEEEDKLYQEYRKVVNEFSDKYDGYRLVYHFNGDNVEFNVEEAKRDSIEEYFKDSFNSLMNIFNTFIR